MGAETHHNLDGCKFKETNSSFSPDPPDPHGSDLWPIRSLLTSDPAEVWWMQKCRTFTCIHTHVNSGHNFWNWFRKKKSQRGPHKYATAHFPGSHYEENVTDKRSRQFSLMKTNTRMSLEKKMKHADIPPQITPPLKLKSHPSSPPLFLPFPLWWHIFNHY